MAYAPQMPAPSAASSWGPPAAGALAGVAADRAYMAFRSTQKMAIAGTVLGAVAVADQLLYGQQASTLQNDAHNIAAATQALVIDATSAATVATGVGAVKQQVTNLANTVELGFFYGQMSNLYGFNSVPSQPVPSASISAGTAATASTTSNTGGLVAVALAVIGGIWLLK